MTDRAGQPGWALRLRARVAASLPFRAFFPLRRTAADLVDLPLDMMRGGGGRSNRFPFVVNINVTSRCNLDCGPCFNACNDIAARAELSLDEYERLADQWRVHGPGIFLTGGEPFLRSDCVEIIAAFKNRGMPVGVVSNGTLLDAHRVEQLGQLDLDALLISIHGYGPTHDRAVGLPGAFDRAMEALGQWEQNGRRGTAMINYVISETSVADLLPFARLLRNRSRARLRLSHLNYLTAAESRAHREAWGERLGDQELELLTHEYEPSPATFQPLQSFLDSPEGRGVLGNPFLDEREIREWYEPGFRLQRPCLFVWRSTYLNSDGVVYPCQGYLVRLGDVRAQPMEAIWNGAPYRRFRSEVRKGLFPGCARCCKL